LHIGSKFTPDSYASHTVRKRGVGAPSSASTGLQLGIFSNGGRVEDYERTMAFADIALGQMKALRQPATPRNYEIWYAYASGYHPALNQQAVRTESLTDPLTQSPTENSLTSPWRSR